MAAEQGKTVSQPVHTWKQTGALAAPEAHKAAAADAKFVYAVTNTQVAKYDRATGRRVAVSRGPAKHLNSAPESTLQTPMVQSFATPAIYWPS